jgi:hypothetical protein
MPLPVALMEFFGEIVVFYNSPEQAYMKQNESSSPLKSVASSKYSFPKLSSHREIMF